MITSMKNNRGFLLIMTMICTFLIMAFLGAFWVMVTGGLRQANKATESTRAYYVADAGLSDAFMQLRARAAFPAAFNTNNANYPVGPNNPIVQVILDTAIPQQKTINPFNGILRHKRLVNIKLTHCP